VATYNKRLQPTLGNPRAAEARRWAIQLNRLFALLAASLVVASAVADSWLPPTPETYTSRYGTYRLTIFPRGLAGALPYFEDKVAGNHPAGQGAEGQKHCEATLERLVGDHYQQLWRRPLINDVAPVSALVSDKNGSFITFDNWHSMGWGDEVMVIYGSDGELKKKLPLTAIMSKTEFENLPRSASSIRWSGKHALDHDENVVLVQVVNGIESEDSKKKYKTVRIHLGTGDVVP
jgi:hypothetical protein